MHTDILINLYIIFSFDFGDDEVQPLAYDSEGKPLNCGDLITVNEDNGNLFINQLLVIFLNICRFETNLCFLMLVVINL